MTKRSAAIDPKRTFAPDFRTRQTADFVRLWKACEFLISASPLTTLSAGLDALLAGSDPICCDAKVVRSVTVMASLRELVNAGDVALLREAFDRIADAGMAKAQRYALPIIVFDSAKPQNLNSATGVIIRTAKGALLATADHVIQEFVRLGDAARMQIGGMGYVLKDVTADRIRISRDVDFGIINLTDDDVTRAKWSALPVSSLHFGGVKPIDLVAYVGFPGCKNKIVSAKLW